MIYILFIILYIFIGAIIYAILEDKLLDNELLFCSIFWPITIVIYLCRLIGYIPYKLTRKVVEFFTIKYEVEWVNKTVHRKKFYLKKNAEKFLETLDEEFHPCIHRV